MKNPQTWNQFNLWIAEKLAMYRDYPTMYNILHGREYKEYKEYYILYDWIGDKKNQLQQRMSNHVEDLLWQWGYRVVYYIWN